MMTLTDVLLSVVLVGLLLGFCGVTYLVVRLQITIDTLTSPHVLPPASQEPWSAPHVLTAEVLDATPAHVSDETETTGTFTGHAWK